MNTSRHIFGMLPLLLAACPEPTPIPVGDVVFYGDLEATLDSYCLRCHRAGGGAPMDLSTYESAKSWGPAMVAAIDAGRMPPPASDPGCRDYYESELLSMPLEDKLRISAWVEQGMPEGDPANDLPISENRFELPEANMEIKITEPYEPNFSVPENQGNDYRCFTIDHDETEPFFITGIHALIDKLEVSHHMVLGKMPRNSEIAERGRQPGGFDCIDDATIAIEGGFIHAWAPGQSPLRFNEGVGLAVTPGESFLLQMHYYKGSDAADGLTDQPGYALVTTDSVETPALMTTYGPTNFTIPAGDPAYTLEVSEPSSQAGKIHAIFPHMHYLGTAYEMSAGDQCVARGTFDFDNQMFYYFREPISASAGDELRIACTWNNSTSNPNLIHNPPIDVSFGENTDMEMCYAFAMVSQ